LLAPFSALAFLTAGIEGCKLLNFSETLALGVGIGLFGFRIINCIDASVKFPERIKETKQSLIQSCQQRDYKELLRLAVIIVASLGYIICTTDAIYNASAIVLGWCGLSAEAIRPLCFTSSAIGAIGTLPLTVYWSHRGLRQLTYGGKINIQGENLDPTDKYTFLGLLMVFPMIIGVLGAATASTGAVFGQLGLFAQITRIAMSIIYATCAGTPGMASFMRGISQKSQQMFFKQSTETTPLLVNTQPAIRVSRLGGFFSSTISFEKQTLISENDSNDKQKLIMKI
jgi:hypothetical protein